MAAMRMAYESFRTWSAAVAAVLLLATFAAGPAGAQNGDARYYALVIGNNDYQHLPDLETAVSDAAAAAELLRSKYGFEIKLMLNATRAELLAEMNRLQGELEDADRLLIYYAGHGILDRVTQTGYWLPTDAREDDDTNWIPNSQLSRYLQRMAARHVMVVADSCYSGTLLREVRAVPSAARDRQAVLQRLASKRARTALVSGGLEPVADGGTNGHSVFASAFLKALRDNEEVLDGQGLFRQVQRQVVLNADQTPQYADLRKAGHEGGDFVLIPVTKRIAAAAPVTSPAGAPPPAASAIDKEALFWQSMQSSQEPADFRDYLKRYPKGDFSGLARRRLKALEGKPLQRTAAKTPSAPKASPVVTPSTPAPALETQPTPPLPAAKPQITDQEFALWQAISESTDPVKFEDYLARYPAGRFSAAAKYRLQTLKPAKAPAQIATVVAPKPAPPVGASGAWRLKIGASSFTDGDLGNVEERITVDGSRYKAHLSRGTFNSWITFTLTGDQIEGRVTVSPGPEWFDLTLKFNGVVENGLFKAKLSGITTVERGGFGRDSRDISVLLHLERAP